MLGNNNRDIVSTITQDIIDNSIGKNYLEMSPSVYEAIKDLKEFNYIHIYDKAYTDVEKEEIKNMFNALFEKLYEVVLSNDKSDNIFTIYLDKMTEEYLNNTSNARKVIDYISGMTDEYFINEYKKINSSK